MAKQNIYGVFIQRGIQLFVVILLSYLLPEVIFYFISFSDAARFEIRRYVMALFIGIFFVSIFRNFSKAGK